VGFVPLVLVTVPMSHNTHPPKTIHATLLDRISENQRLATMQNDEQKDSEKKVSAFIVCVTSQHSRDTIRKLKLIESVA